MFAGMETGLPQLRLGWNAETEGNQWKHRCHTNGRGMLYSAVHPRA